LDFGNLRGSNKLEHCEVLIVIGTYKVNIEALQKDFEKIYHKQPWSTEAVKLSDGGYRCADPDLENFRKMCEDNEMYQAIHRVRPALRQKKIFVFGLIPDEIRMEFEVKDLSFEFERIEENDKKGVMRLVEWRSFEQFLREHIGDEGAFQSNLVTAICNEYGINKSSAWARIRKFVDKFSEEYEITEKTIGSMRLKFVRKRR